MNKKIMLAVAGAAAMSFAQVSPTFLWDGTTDTQGKVETGSEEETSGYWYDYTDKDNEGTSAFTFPADVEANEYDNFYGPLIEAYGGIKGSVSLGAGYEYPFAGLGFNIWSEAQEGVDITAWGGICVSYQSTLGFAIELGVADEATVTEYNNYKATVSKSATVTVGDFPWAKFKQESGWGVTVPQATVLGSTAAIKFKFSGTAGTTGDFLIQKVGSTGMCTASGVGIKEVAAAGSVKATLSGRTVSFQGISSAKAEVINLQGQVVKSATVSATMDLSSLDAGVYMLRVAGKSVKLTQKIVLE
ncbi:MAG: T9SS type A sorting domain-containing protein [Fibrobacter sp.]|jgi:hypothetical protein|nr:T9SS type A sorting domain-containing protein [Fibrobacter sp.]